MKGLTASLWPVRYKPYPDELLTSWLIRLAWGHGLKAQTFCNRVFGGRHQVWNRDSDRLAPVWLINALVEQTGTPRQIVYGTTLRAYEGILYPHFRPSGTLPWVQTLMVYHRSRRGYGVQFCPVCLAEDECPYFRRAWRVSFNTMCMRHGVMLHDRCPACGMPVVYHRMEMGRGSVFEVGSMADCHACGFSLVEAPRQEIWGYDSQALSFHLGLCRALTEPAGAGMVPDKLRVMHQLIRLMVSRYKTISLRQYVSKTLGVDDPIEIAGRVFVETQPLVARHHLIQLAAWLMVDLATRLEGAWRAGTLRYNHLEKDFDEAPDWYRSIADLFMDWRRHKRSPG
ncbi:TniQ family protein [Leeia aquatica]|uniref:TniQ family protein n=1 Tax=Leeia aquatica TaxID=2725557 RepID=A0A847SCW4_9NEIS|nr:TniQ family protein [Leeia aquatica]NLR75306.1 TniQ family protein [Leeia aquatica]